MRYLFSMFALQKLIDVLHLRSKFIHFYILLFLLSTLAQPILAVEVDFYGGIYRWQVDKPITVQWDNQYSTGYQLKIIHYFYTGLETEIVETTDTTYVFTNMPKSSRHFEVQVRSYNESTEGVREYSTWSSSTNAECSVVNGNSSGWLIYTYPSAPSW